MRLWLDELGVTYPAVASRFPTGMEIKSVVQTLDHYTIEITDNGQGATWQALIVHKDGGDRGPWTLLNITKYAGDNEEQELWFEKGYPELITLILIGLSRTCGPLVLIPDTGETPTVIAG